MRLLLEAAEQTWCLDPGLTLIGTGPGCAVRLEAGPHCAAALVWWFQQVTLYPVGELDTARVNGQTHSSHALRHGDLLQIGGFTARLRFDPAPSRGLDRPTGAELARRVHRAIKAGRRYAELKGDKERGQQLLRVVSSLTGARQARWRRRKAAGQPDLRLYRSRPLSLGLSWGSRPAPEPEALDQGLAALASAVDDFSRWEERTTLPIVPYRDYTLHVRHQDLQVGAYATFGWSDLNHLGVPHAEFREPLLLAATFEERLHLVDLSASGALEVAGRPVVAAEVNARVPIRLLGHALLVVEHDAASTLLPMRLQSALSAPDQPLRASFALRRLLGPLRTPEERAEACLLAAVTLGGAHAGALVWTAPGERAVVTTLVEISRHVSSGWMRTSGIPSSQLDALVRKSIAAGGPISTQALLEDEIACAEGHRRGEPVAVVGGAAAIPLRPPGAVLLLTRVRGRRPFSSDGLRTAAEIARFIDPLEGLPRPLPLLAPPAAAEPPDPASWLQAGRLRVPLPDEGTTLLGREEHCDLRVSGDGTVSRIHAMVVTTLRPRGCQVFDLRSANGTFVDGKLVEQAPLSPGSRLGIGELELVYETDGARCSAVDELAFCPVSTAILDLRPVPLGALQAASPQEALEQSLPALALVAGASKARWVREGLFDEQSASGASFLVPATLDAGGWIVLDGIEPDRARVRSSRLVLQGEGISTPIDHPIWIGRGPECDLRIASDVVSRRHALVVPTAGGCEVVDARSSTGTRLNGEPVTKASAAEGDLIELGPCVLVLARPESAEELPAGGLEDARRLLRELAALRADKRDPLEAIGENLQRQTRATGTAILLAGSQQPLISFGQPAQDWATWNCLSGAIETALGSGCAVVEDLDEPRLYHVRHMTVPFAMSAFRAALVVPIPRKPPTVAVAFTARLPRVAFDFAAVRWISALIGALY